MKISSVLGAKPQRPYKAGHNEGHVINITNLRLFNHPQVYLMKTELYYRLVSVRQFNSNVSVHIMCIYVYS